MDQLRKAAQEAAEKLKEKMAKNPLEKALNEATSDVNWNASNKVLQEIADHTYSFGDFTEVMKHIWKKIGSERKGWRKILKTLSLIEYLIKNGSPRCIQEFRDEIYQIRTLQDFSHYEDGQDRGAAIREVSKRVVQLLSDEQKIDEERKKAQEMRERLGEMRAFGSGGESKGGFSGGSGSRYGGSGSGGYGGGSYGGYSSKDTGSRYGGTGSGSENYRGYNDKGSYDDSRKVGSWRVEKIEEKGREPERDNKGDYVVKSGTKYDISSPEEKKPELKEKPKASVIPGPGGNKVLPPPKGSKIQAPVITQAQNDTIDLLGDDAPSQPTTTTQNNKADPFNWDAPQTQTQTQSNPAESQWNWGNGNTQQQTTTQQNTQSSNSPFNWDQPSQNTQKAQPSSGNIQNLYQQQQQPQNSFGFPNQPTNQGFNSAPQNQTQGNMNNLANQFGSLNFGGPQSNTGFNNQPSGGFNNNTKPQTNVPFNSGNQQNGKNDGFDDFQVAKPTSNIGTNVEYKNYSQAEKSIIDLSDIASEANKKKDHKDKINAAKNSNEGILYSTNEDLDNFFINPPQNNMGMGINMNMQGGGFHGGMNMGMGNMGQGGFGGMQQQNQQMGFGGQMGYGGQMNMGMGNVGQGGFGGMQGGMNQNAGFSPMGGMGGNFQGGYNQNQMGGMNSGFGFK